MEMIGQAKIEADEIVIRVPIKSLKDIVRLMPDTVFEKARVTDAKQAAKSIVRRLNEEGETGTTLIHRAFDQAIDEALEQGDDGLDC